ncbi:group II intron reverse transcriptase/maturase [Clostridium felsineum]|uniref:group II intron reverse transcriptase/maturase n=1 Tax=Clostridium felsineum TaxID=36839 RepID=UPI00214D5020|nr:group II intron reverse transcriptase/maturase [Clostridium felsineum]MCR3761931.1 group II intron reverse transcriptase/maturase [Clostridium felsineum]
MKNSKEMQKLQTTSYKEGWSCEIRVELKNSTRAHSISTAFDRRKDDGKLYDNNLLEKILDRQNMNFAYKRVKSNKGSHGVDGMKVDELLQYLKQNGKTLIASIFNGIYSPKAVRRVEIPKPNGGIRLLGIPTVVDRTIQQAIAQVLTPIFEKTFSENSYGFRPKRDAKQAIKKAKEYMEKGYKWVVDIDLEKYFDTVNHDKLMALVAREIKDKRVLKLIRLYLQSGVMINGVVFETEEGCPQGSPLSPLLSNIMLTELDRELEKRGHKFCRYADDNNIYVKSKKAGYRVMQSITKFIESKLKLKVNKDKSAVDRPWKRKFLGFTFYQWYGKIGIRVHEKSVRKFKAKIKAITARSNALNMENRIIKLRQCIIGWLNYFRIADIRKLAKKLDEWIRRRLRMCLWKQWKKIKTKYDNLRKFGINNSKAWEFANTRKSYWRIANSPILATTLTNSYLEKIGYTSILKRYKQVH